MTTNLRRGRHSVSALLVHLVFVSKYRKKVFDKDGLKTLENAFNGVARQMNFQIVEFNGESDHVHLLVEYPPKISISQLVNHLKGVSSRLYRQKHPSPSSKHLWSPSYYAASAGGAPIEVLKEYIQNHAFALKGRGLKPIFLVKGTLHQREKAAWSIPGFGDAIS